MEVFVTGMGVVTALGIGVEANLAALKSEHTGISTFDTSKGPKLKGGLRKTDDELKAILNIESDAQVPRTILLAMLACDEAIGKTPSEGTIRTGLINGTTTGGMDLSEKHFDSLYMRQDASGVRNLLTHDLGTGTQLLAERLGISEYVNTLSTACSSAANAIMLGSRMLRAGILDRVLVGGTDALTNFTVDGFGSLMIYDTALCRPFDEERVGLNLGEGAGFILLENERSLEASGNKKLGKCVGWSNANDAYHQTGTSPEGDGAYLSMKESLEMAGLAPADIDYLNAHGTATKNNDNSELSAIDRIFGDSELDFSSTKAYTGHTLAAAGGVEAVFSLLSIQHGCAFPNLRWKNQMSGSKRKPTTEWVDKEVNTVMSNSFGFGGNSTSLIFSKA